MSTDTPTRRVLVLASPKGLLRASHLDGIRARRVVLTRLTATGLSERAGRGLYRLPSQPASEHEALAAVAPRMPQALFCLLAAPQPHELTAQLSRHAWIARPRGSHAPRLKYPPIKMCR